MSAPKSALIIGATGQTGRALLRELLASPQFSRVGEYGRRVTPAEEITSGKDKLEQKVVDFEKIDEAGLQTGRWDVVYITLGTTRGIAGSDAAFEKIDRDYVISAAAAAKVPDHQQRLVYLSSGGANPSSLFLYTRSKGQTEIGLAKLGYNDTVIFRPGLLAGVNRKDSRIMEAIAGHVTGLLSHVSNSVEIQISVLGKAMCRAGILGSSALPTSAKASEAGTDGARFTVISNAGSIALGSATET